MEDRKSVPWSNAEVQTFLCLVGDEKIQSELDGASRNERVYSEVSSLMAAHVYERTTQQCKANLKKLKSDYRAVKDHNGRSGTNRKDWKWFTQMDAIYGHRPASNGRDSVLDSASLLLEATENDSPSTGEAFSTASLEPPVSPVSDVQPAASTPAKPRSPLRRSYTGKRKRSHADMDVTSVIDAMQAHDNRNHEQRERHIQLLLHEARESREQEAVLRREEMAQNLAFNHAFLGVMGDLVKAMRERRV